ncbi:MFS-type efflux pump MSMEG_3705-like [Liolophura sinensis]|uniref:MFS-type efflux pump MSMEG_3705-like n=1 Tax=Liolophura sinensis TaxID=3198878 RepID=UPI003158B67E
MGCCDVKDVRPYSVFVLVLLLLAYLLNQLDRYMLAITVKPMAQDVHFGDHDCMVNTSFTDVEVGEVKCNAKNETSCVSTLSINTSLQVCKWDYDGQGFEYQIVAGPAFTAIYTFTGIFIAFAADVFNRKLLLAICLMFWSLMTLLTGFINSYWQLVILRFGLGMGEAGCTPFATSLISDYFSESTRGSALGLYNWGIYMGYSLSYAVGNFITAANINNQGWRWSFFISGIPGLVLGIVILLAVKEPERKTKSEKEKSGSRKNVLKRLGTILKPFCSPSLLLLCFAGSVRNAAGYVWAYNTQPFFSSTGQTAEQIGTFMSWIPLVGGSIGVVLGGFISDRIVQRRGLYARVIVLVLSQLLAAPFAAGTLLFSAPWGYICQIPTYIIGEMWVGVTLAVLVELVPTSIRTGAVAVYLFIITNIGGTVPLAVPPLQQSFVDLGYTKNESLKDALYILYSGMYVGGSAMFLVTMLVLKRDQRRVKENEYKTEEPSPDTEKKPDNVQLSSVTSAGDKERERF